MLKANNPFYINCNKQLLISFSTGFTSTADDSDNVEKAPEVEMEMQIKHAGQSVTSTKEIKFKKQALSSFKNILMVNERKIHINSLKLFNQVIILAE